MVKKFLLALILCVLFIIPESYSQAWKRERDHLVIGLGASSFMGDLGGADREGSNGIMDFDFYATRPAFLLGYRYYIIEDIAVRGNLSFGYIAGDDKFTDEAYRSNRNIHFRSPLWELAVQGEYYFIRAYQMGARYRRVTRARGWFGYNFSAYAFIGVGGFYFNPQGKFESANYTGTVPQADLPSDGWYNLRPLRTEGQSYFSTRDEYSKISLTVPFGLGAIFVINRQLSVGIEYGFRKTWTDYIDDVSRTYVDPAIYHEMFEGNPEKIALSEYFSNPTTGQLGDNVTAPGQQRGNPHNTDSYMFTLITIYYNMPQLRPSHGLPRF
ncbi:MAG: hypothetical protein R6U11_07950 [Bacteroidales bacterium]